MLLAEHRRRVEAGAASVLFGVAPDSPVERTRAEWLESLGRNPFVEISVPDASFKLIQAVGRLLRTQTDAGRVTVLDRRLVETR